MPLIYGLNWPEKLDLLTMEMEFVRGGGYIEFEGRKHGKGLLHHFKAMQSLIWPEDDHHRWSDLILSNILKERITVIMGSRDSSKTRTVSKWALCDYWCFPEKTLILMTSTDTRGLELRVWGDIKDLFDRARKRYPWLAGNLVDAKHGLFTDNISEDDEVRDMRKGIIGIPCISSQGEFMGMTLKNFAGIKQERRRLIGDECFLAGTMVNTFGGLRRIESIVPGDIVLSAVGYRRVLATSKKTAMVLVRVNATDGRKITCTPEHLFLTQKGWKRACELNQEHYILGPHECLHQLRKTNHQQKGVLSEVLVRVNVHTNRRCDSLHRGEEEKGVYQGQASDAHRQSDVDYVLSHEGKPDIKRIGAQTESARRKWNRSHQSRTKADAVVSDRTLELSNKDGETEREWIPPYLQGGFGVSQNTNSHRGRRAISLELESPEGEGFKERQIPRGAWVDGVEIQEPNDSGIAGGCEKGSEVFNLQVEGHPSYCVEGLVVHNCQFIPVEYLKILDSLDKGDFVGSLLGNPIAENGKALDTVSEPKDGWGSLPEITKTTTWRNRYNGITINLVGTDSPNFDKETFGRYPYLIDQSDVDRVSSRPGGKDSLEWWSQIVGVRKVGVIINRVLTEEMIKNGGGFDTCIWHGSDLTKIYAVDAGYGGDECVRTYLEFGMDVSGRNVILFGEQKVIPVLLSSPVSPEDQIATFSKTDCAELGVPDANVFIEAGMRATLAVSFSRIMSPAINAVNFGGPATQRPVSADLLIFDEQTQQRRLKTCYEHYSKFVTELAFSVRAVVESKQARGFPRQAASEFAKRQWSFVSGDRYELETKEQYKIRNSGRSPNYSDSLMIGVEGARRLGFVIESAVSDDKRTAENEDYLTKELQKYRHGLKRRTLSYT